MSIYSEPKVTIDLKEYNNLLNKVEEKDFYKVNLIKFIESINDINEIMQSSIIVDKINKAYMDAGIGIIVDCDKITDVILTKIN